MVPLSHPHKESNQLILKEISTEYSLEGPTLKLKLQYFGHLMQRTDSLEKTLMLGKIEGGRRRGLGKEGFFPVDTSRDRFSNVGTFFFLLT